MIRSEIIPADHEKPQDGSRVRDIRGLLLETQAGKGGLAQAKLVRVRWSDRFL